MDTKHLSYTKWKCQYHIVFIPKYRKKVLYGKLRLDVKDILSTLCRYKGVEVIWARGYYVSTIGNITEEAIRKCIEEQSDESRKEETTRPSF